MRLFRTAILCLALLPAAAGAYTYPQLKSFRTSTAWTNEVINRITLTRVIVSMSGTPTNTTAIYLVNGTVTTLLVSATSSSFTTAIWPPGTNAPNAQMYPGDRLLAVNSSTNFASLYIYGTDAVTNSGGGGTGSGFPLTGSVSAAGFNISAVGTLTANSAILGAAEAGTLALSDGTVDQFADITTTYLTAGNTGTDPGGTRGRLTLSKSGTAISLAGWLVGFTNNAAGNLFYIDPGSTGAVETLFLKSGTSGVGRLYYSDQSSPNNYVYKDLPINQTGALLWAGTGFQFAQLTNAIGTATNTILFGDRDTNYWRNFANQTNLTVMDDGVAVIVAGAAGVPLLGFDGGSNVSVQVVTQVVAGKTGVVARLNSGGGSGWTNDLLFAINSWAESNSFAKAISAPRVNIHSRGNTMTGEEAQVLGGATNTASGRGAIAGGIGSTASGDGSVALGNGNTASGTGASAIGALGVASTYSTVGGYDNQASGVGSRAHGRNNRVPGDYSTADGEGITLSSSYGSGQGAYILVTQQNAHVIGRGLSSLFPLSPGLPNMLLLANESDTNVFRVGIGVRSPTGTLQVAGSVVADRFYGDGSALINIPGSTQTGQVDSISYTGSVGGPITFAGAGVTQTNRTFNFRGGVGYADTNGFTNSGGVALLGPVTLGGAHSVTARYAFASGFETTANAGGPGANASGYRTIASGLVGANANGLSTTASGEDGANANGRGSVASGDVGANANGHNTTASGADGANANGVETVASGDTGANANGVQTVASGDLGASANGYGTTASGDYSMAAGGMNNVASGDGSFAAGVNAVASNAGAFVWSDHNEGSSVGSPMANSFTIRATNGWWSTLNTSAPFRVLLGNTFYGDGSGLTNIPGASADGGATGFVFSGLSGAYDPTTRTLSITNTGGSGGVTPTGTYGVAIVGASSNVFIVDPGSASNLVLMSSGAGYVPQFRAHPWASSGSVAAAVSSLSNWVVGQSFATSNNIVTAANSANATSLQGIAWSSDSPSIGWFPIMTASGWKFTNAAPSSSTGSAVNSVSAGTNTLYGNLVLAGTGNVTITSTAAQDGTMVVGAGTWYTTQDANEQKLTNVNIVARSLMVGEGNSPHSSSSNNVSLVGGSTFNSGARGNVSAGMGITFNNSILNSFAAGSNIVMASSFSGACGRDLNNGANYCWVSGFGNSILSGGQFSTITSGYLNTNEGAFYATIGGGTRNAQGSAALFSYIPGGATNRVDAIGGGAIGHSGFVPSTATNGLIINVGRTRETNALPHGITIVAPGTVVVKVGGMTFTVGTGTVSAAVGTGSFSFAESGLIVNGVLK